MGIKLCKPPPKFIVLKGYFQCTCCGGRIRNEQGNRQSFKKDILRFKKSPCLYEQGKRLAAKKMIPLIKRKDVDIWFQIQLTTTLHKPVRYRFRRNKIIVMGIGHQYQADLCDMSNISKYNEGYKYLLTCIDCFSRLAWVKPLKTKQGLGVGKAHRINISRAAL